MPRVPHLPTGPEYEFPIPQNDAERAFAAAIARYAVRRSAEVQGKRDLFVPGFIEGFEVAMSEVAHIASKSADPMLPYFLEHP
jgi:hypothetical protein